MREDRITLMCPKCGSYLYPLRNEHTDDVCDFCGETRVEIDLDYEVFDDCPTDFYESQAFEEKTVYRKFLYNNPKYDEKTFEKRLEMEEEEEKGFQKQLDEIRAKSYADNNPRCPKCGSTAIQAVPRKWGLFAGIFTNKVDRVCLNCKHKF